MTFCHALRSRPQQVRTHPRPRELEWSQAGNLAFQRFDPVHQMHEHPLVDQLADAEGQRCPAGVVRVWSVSSGGRASLEWTERPAL